MEKQNNASGRLDVIGAIRSYRRWWPLMLLVTCLGTLAGILWVYRMPARFEVKASILATDTSKDSDLMGAAARTSLFGSKVSTDEEAEKLKSHDLLKSLVKKYNLQVDKIYNKNFIKREKKYFLDTPMELVVPESMCDTLTSVLVFKIKVNSQGLVSVKAKNHERDVVVDVKDCRFPVELKTLYGDMTLEKTPEFESYVKNDGLPLQMTIMLSSYDNAAEDLSKLIMPTVPNKKADVIQLSYICSNRDFGKMLMTDFINGYNEIGMRETREKGERVNEYLDSRIAELHSMVTNKEAQAEAFAREHNLVNPLQDGAVDYKISAEIKKDIIGAQTSIEKLNMIKALLEDSDNDYSMLPLPTGDNQLAKLIEGYNSMVQQKMRLEIDAKPTNRALMAVVEQIDAYKANILVSIDKAIEHAQGLLAEARRQKGGLDSRVQNMNSVTREFTDIMRDHEITNAVYLLLIKEREHNNMKMRNTLPAGVIIDAPHVAKKQPGLDKKIFLFLVFCISLASVPVALYVWSLVDDRIKDVDSLRKIFPDADILGSLPDLTKKQLKSGLPAVESEEFRSRMGDICVATQFETRKVKSPVVAVTSVRPGQGRSTVAVGLAMSYAAAGKRTVLVGLDFNNRTLADTLSIDTSKGLAAMVTSGKTDVLQHVVAASAGFDVVVAGRDAVSAMQMLGALDLPEIIARLRQTYDVVIVDAPAMSESKELEVVAPVADMTICVVRAKSASYVDVRYIASVADKSPCALVVNAVRRPTILTLWK